MTAIAARAYAPGVAYRFSRGGVEFSGKGPEEFAGVVRARFTLSAEGRKIADAVKTALNASVVLHDAEKREHQVARAGERWLSIQTTATDEPQVFYVTSRINDRWTLYVCSRRRLHPDAQSLADWAAQKLAQHVPDRTADEPASPPFGRGGSSGGSAEVGIPVWWARKARN
jgi:hypothetical protein